MNIHVRSSFKRDMRRLSDSATALRIEEAIKLLEAAESLREVSHIEKIAGWQDAFRLRVGDYRIGFFLLEGEVHLSRCLQRKEAYRHFPE